MERVQIGCLSQHLRKTSKPRELQFGVMKNALKCSSLVFLFECRRLFGRVGSSSQTLLRVLTTWLQDGHWYGSSVLPAPSGSAFQASLVIGSAGTKKRHPVPFNSHQGLSNGRDKVGQVFHSSKVHGSGSKALLMTHISGLDTHIGSSLAPSRYG